MALLARLKHPFCSVSHLLGGSVEDIAARIPVRRIGIPEDIAATCSFLVSEEAGYITGQIVGVNGGRCT